MKTPTVLALLLTAIFCAPTALANAELPDMKELVDIGELVLPCGSITGSGIIPYTICWVYVIAAVGEWAACATWKLLWGPGAPCLTV